MTEGRGLMGLSGNLVYIPGVLIMLYPHNAASLM